MPRAAGRLLALGSDTKWEALVHADERAWWLRLFEVSLIVSAHRMNDQQLLERIYLDPKIMAGKAVIKGTRLTVVQILNLLAHGATAADILQEYNGLTADDIQVCLLFASKSLAGADFMPLGA